MNPRSAATLIDMAGEVGYALRLPPELKARLEELARQDRRSLNSEIVHLLEVAAEKAEALGRPTQAARRQSK